MHTLPIVDRLTTQYQDCITRVDANYASPSGQRIANTYGVKSHPVVVLIDAHNTIVFRSSGVPDEARLTRSIATLCRQSGE